MKQQVSTGFWHCHLMAEGPGFISSRDCSAWSCSNETAQMQDSVKERYRMEETKVNLIKLTELCANSIVEFGRIIQTLVQKQVIQRILVQWQKSPQRQNRRAKRNTWYRKQRKQARTLGGNSQMNWQRPNCIYTKNYEGHGWNVKLMREEQTITKEGKDKGSRTHGKTKAVCPSHVLIQTTHLTSTVQITRRILAPSILTKIHQEVTFIGLGQSGIPGVVLSPQWPSCTLLFTRVHTSEFCLSSPYC